LEVRVPFLDHKVVEFAYSLPLKLKLRGGRGKYLLRKAMRRHFPSTHLDVAKRGFRIPMVPWMRGELAGWMQAALQGPCEASPFLNYDGVRQVWEWFEEGRSHLTDVLSIVLSLTLSSPVWARGSAEAKKR
jgi:asparagine synthase (glutamine-hydrolysing)